MLCALPLTLHAAQPSHSAALMNSAHKNAAKATLACIVAQKTMHVDGPPMSFASTIQPAGQKMPVTASIAKTVYLLVVYREKVPVGRSISELAPSGGAMKARYIRARMD